MRTGRVWAGGWLARWMMWEAAGEALTGAWLRLTAKWRTLEAGPANYARTHTHGEGRAAMPAFSKRLLLPAFPKRLLSG